MAWGYRNVKSRMVLDIVRQGRGSSNVMMPVRQTRKSECWHAEVYDTAECSAANVGEAHCVRRTHGWDRLVVVSRISSISRLVAL